MTMHTPQDQPVEPDQDEPPRGPDDPPPRNPVLASVIAPE